MKTQQKQVVRGFVNAIYLSSGRDVRKDGCPSYTMTKPKAANMLRWKIQ